MYRDIPKPQPDEHAAYTIMYYDLIPDDGRVLDHLATSVGALRALVAPMSPEKLSTPWKEGEWTIKEIILHIIDDERIFAYRALRFARGDDTDLPGFDQDTYVEPSRANERSIDSLFEEYESVRAGTLTLFASFDEEALLRKGTADGNPMSVRAAAYHIAGHAKHHEVSIRENYGE